MPRPSVAIVDMGAFERNYIKLKSKLSNNCMFMSVVKSNAYGHGLIEIAAEAERLGSDYLGVALVEEGVSIRNNGVNIPILMMGNITPDTFSDAIENDIDVNMFDMKRIIELNNIAKILGKTARIHLKIDTGMNRLGIRSMQDFEDILDCIAKSSNIKLIGVFSHFASGGDYLFSQYERFLLYKKLAVKFDSNIIFHMANSLAAINYPITHFDMVRYGIALYGYAPTILDEKNFKTEPVMTLKTKTSQVFEISKGESVGYGQSYFATADKTAIGTIPIGYADGYIRALSNIGYALVNGVRVPVVGNVCMDQCMLDLSNVPELALEQEVILIGKSFDQKITAEDLGNLVNTISYEILTGISSRVKREYV